MDKFILKLTHVIVDVSGNIICTTNDILHRKLVTNNLQVNLGLILKSQSTCIMIPGDIATDLTLIKVYQKLYPFHVLSRLWTSMFLILMQLMVQILIIVPIRQMTFCRTALVHYWSVCFVMETLKLEEKVIPQ